MRVLACILLMIGAVSTAAAQAATGAGREIRVAGAHIAVTRDVSTNLAAIERALTYAVKEKADILLTPECALSGYLPDFDEAATVAALEKIRAEAQKAGVALALGTCYLEPEGGQKYDELRFYRADGEYLGFHAKILLCAYVAKPSKGDEINQFGTRPLRTFELKGVKVGGLICNDLWANPEYTPQADSHLTQQLSGQGAKIIFHAVDAGEGNGEALELNRRYHESNLRMRARSGKVWIVTVDAVSTRAGFSNQAPSGVMDPTGHWAVRVESDQEEFFAYTIKLDGPEQEQPH